MNWRAGNNERSRCHTARLSAAIKVPFTFSHPAAVLPLRRFGDLSALVIGSMVPDAGYLLILDLPRHLTHGSVGLVVFCIPVGLGVYFFYHGLLRRPFMHLMPNGVRLRLSERTAFPTTSTGWIRVLFGLVLGSATHLLWDALPYPASMEKVASQLMVPLVRTIGLNPGSTDWLRCGMAVLGLLVMSLYGWRAYRLGAPRIEPPGLAMPVSMRLLLALALVGTTLALSRALTELGRNPYLDYHGPGATEVRLAIGAFTFTLFGYALIWQACAWRRGR